MSVEFIPSKNRLARFFGIGTYECSVHKKKLHVGEVMVGCIDCRREAYQKAEAEARESRITEIAEAREARITEIAEGVSRALKENS